MFDGFLSPEQPQAQGGGAANIFIHPPQGCESESNTIPHLRPAEPAREARLRESRSAWDTVSGPFRMMRRDAARGFNAMLWLFHLVFSLICLAVSTLNPCPWYQSGVSRQLPSHFQFYVPTLSSYARHWRHGRNPLIVCCPALFTPHETSVPRVGRISTQYSFSAKFSNTPGRDYMWVIVDSGTSRHILNTDEFYLASEESNVSFTGIGGHKETAKKHGIWAGLCMDKDGKDFHFCSFGAEHK